MSLVADLLRPLAYEGGATEIALVETHISWVFLLEHDVFKVKKPVNLGFLDFRNLEQRKVACDAEVRLNARLAPQVYRGVVPVCLGDDGHCRVGVAQGPIVDWAVHMIRLPDTCRADELVASSDLSREALDAIAKRMAAFHAASTSDATISSFGAPSAIRRNIEENFTQTREAIGQYLPRAEVDEIEQWQIAFVRESEGLFEKRIRAGRVRDGHGDLRLEHVYLEEASVTIIDCIEFNDRFRFADVCADIAFLSMDLAAHGRVDLAEGLIASYARESNDFDLYALVDFYESYRAYVRGKVSTFLLSDDAVDAATRERVEREARRYFLLALSADRRSLLRPALVAVGGIIASGKSTIAQHIGAEMSAPVVDADRTRKAMVGVEASHALHDSVWQGAYDPAFTDDVYREVLRRAGVVLASGRPVVVDASFRSQAMRQAVRDLARDHGVPFRFVECRADAAVCRARLVERERTGGVSDGRLEIFDAFRARFEPVTEVPSPEHVIVDTSRLLEDSIAALRARLETWPSGFVT